MSLKGVDMYMYATNFIPKQIIVTSHVVVPGIWMQKNNSVHNFSISHNETLWISIKKQLMSYQVQKFTEKSRRTFGTSNSQDPTSTCSCESFLICILSLKLK